MVTYSTKGTCSKQIIFDLDEDNKVHNLGEKYPVKGAYLGVQQLMLTALMCAGIEGVDSVLE